MLLQKLGVDFEVVVSDVEELLDPKLKSTQQAENISIQKAKHVDRIVTDSIIISADTTVVLGDLVLGKPKNKNEAKKMLNILSGKMHKVITGVTVIDQNSRKIITKSIESRVWFRKLDKFEIENYINEFQPFDKAGGVRHSRCKRKIY